MGAYSNTADLLKVLDAARVDRAALVGLSSGGGIALDFVLVHPERVSALVLGGPLVGGFVNSSQLQARIDRLAAASRVGLEEGITAFLDDPHFIPAVGNPLARDLARQLLRDNARPVAMGRATALDPPAVNRLAEINVPTLLVVGEFDHPDIHRRVSFLSDSLRNALKLVFPGGGHMLNMEHAPLFSLLTSTFLRTRQ